MLPVAKKRVFRGLDRQLIRKLENALASIDAMDARKTSANNPLDPFPSVFFFAVAPSTKAAITTLQNVIANALTLTY